MGFQFQMRVAIRYSLIAVITLTSIALIAEILPEVHAKPIVVAALASALALMLIELYRIRRAGANHGYRGNQWGDCY